MKTSVSSFHQPASPRCAEIRKYLEDFAAKRLGPTARGAVQGHLLGCDACSDALAELLMDKVEDGSLPMLTPPPIPPPAVYEAYLRARRPGSSWRAVLEAMLDPGSSAWASDRINEIRAGFALLMNPLPTRGAMRTRGSVVRPPGLVANVLTPTGEPTGATVTFRVVTPPAVTIEGRFRLVALTDDVAYEGRRVVCTIALPPAEPLSFDGTLARGDAPGPAVLAFDEEGLPARNCSIPLDRVTLSIS